MPADTPTPLGQDPVFLELMRQVSRAAPLARPALVVGERGTGKELVAARLHYLSPRWDRPLLKLNCAALSETLLESELFGHEAGAFTDARQRRAGRFELADGGTLFLDEIATASPRIQEKLLRVVEYGQFERVGGSQTLTVDVRLVAATNADLPALAAAGGFRADLLDRLAFDVLTVPPLRARPGDILLLADHFGIAMAQELGRPLFPGFAPAAAARLLAHGWPGNVRELKNVVERAVYRADPPDQPIEELVFDPFASPWRPAAAAPAPGERPSAPADPPLPLPEAVAALERRMLAAALARCRFNRRRAAAELGLSYDQLRGYLRRHGLPEAGTGEEG
jgi:psp operon transcriptional activator